MIEFATVTSASPFKVRFFKDTNARETQYYRLAWYTPTVNDVVAFLSLGDIKLCLGKVVK